jgi:ribonuclease HII
MKPMWRIAGIDEAGRGPVIGPMVVAGVLVREELLGELLALGVKDSKKLSPKKRESLVGDILKVIDLQHVETIQADQIDERRKGESLNWIEATAMAKILNVLRPDIAQVGSVDVVCERFSSMILSEMAAPVKIDSIHHAEDRFPAVAAASIIAKVTRDSLVTLLRMEYGDFGSGYPSDAKTRSFIKEWYAKEGSLPPIVRKSWKTAHSLVDLQRELSFSTRPFR